MLADLNDAPEDAEDDEEIDLLDGIAEDQGESWIPANDDDQPRGIQGALLSKDYIDNDYGEDPIPLLTIEQSDGHTWSIRGYHKVLRDKINQHDPEPGDQVAFKYFGKVKAKNAKKNDNPYENYGMACPACVKRKRG